MIANMKDNKNIEKVLREKELHMRLFMQSTGDCIWNWDMISNKVERSIGFKRAFGYTSDEILPGIEWWVERLHPDDKDNVLKIFESACKEGLSNSTYEYRFRRKDGTYATLIDNVCIIRDEANNVIRSLGAMQDITERKKYEDLLLMRSEIVTNMTQGAYIIRLSDGNIIYANRAFENMFGYEANEMIGQHASIVNNPSDTDPVKKAQLILEAIKKDGFWHGEINNIKKDGTSFWCSTSVTTFEHPVHGAACVSIHTDITEQRRNEELIRQSQKMNALDNLTGGIAHDYNNILGIISGYSELLKEDLPGETKLYEYAHEIKHAADRATALTSKLLNFSRKNNIEASSVNLNELIQEEKLMLEKTLTARIKLVLNLEDNLWHAWLNSNDMIDAIVNLSINAMHAIERHGTITITTKNIVLDNKKSLFLGLEPGEHVLINFSDTGSGMSKTTLERIFEPFYSTKGDLGNGLGLSQVYGFIHRSNGEIRVDSQLGHGTDFEIYFPHCEAISPILQTTEKPIKTTKNNTILVVDDEPALTHLVREILSNHAENIIVANDGASALAIMEEHSVDLLISDIIMPDMDGVELTNIVKKKYSSTKILLISGYNNIPETYSENNQLLEQILRKPFSSIELIKRVDEMLNAI